jgi:diaminopimelate epimerase
MQRETAMSKPLTFSKMHGLGNDFVVIDAIHQDFQPTAAQCRFLADRRFGIGCDQILLVERPRDAETDFFYRIFNSDGSEVEQCGNGARCFARFVSEHGLSAQTEIAVGTRGGNIRLYLEAGNQVRVNMGRPRFAPDAIPFSAAQEQDSYALQVGEQTLRIGAVSMGNPHAVLRVAAVDNAAVAQLGPLIEAHARFPQRVNVGFMQIENRRQIRLRVFERGTGETLACGTGACAAAVVGQRQGLLDAGVRVKLPGGDLVIQWVGGNEPVWMTGAAEQVFEGEINL